MKRRIVAILSGVERAPEEPTPDGRPAAYAVAEWLANECATLDDARACWEYLATWPEGPQGNILPVARVAAILDLTRQAVHQQIARGYIHAVKVGHTRFVPLREVERWRPVKAGRPRKSA